MVEGWKMRQTRIPARIFAALLSLGLTTFSLPFSSSGSGEQIALEQLLEKSAAYCERVKNIALFYVCKERITDREVRFRMSSSVDLDPYGDPEQLSTVTVLEPLQIQKRSYLYDYQLVNQDDNLMEQRVLLRENSAAREVKDAELKVPLVAKYVIYGAVGFLSSYWQNLLQYELMGEDSVSGMPAVIIAAVPKPENTDNRNHARIWVHAEDGSILKIEWSPESIGSYGANQKLIQAKDIQRYISWKVTYGIEKNGIRFPSNQHVQDFFYNTGEKRKYVRQDIVYIYTGYKFFVVETAIRSESL